MVTFDIESKTSDKVVYKYFPENHRDCKPGIFSISLITGEVLLEAVAEEDHICRTSAGELSAMRDAINEMQAENGEPPLTEKELPIATEDEEWYYYVDHAIRRVRDELEKGIIPESGTVAWY
ncbi:MAG: hypothetical protein E6551_04100 [Lachnospiraceae bacterium]|nr:hypothetical protein [Lachnospiraceae bacterium]